VWRFVAPNAGDWHVVLTPTDGSDPLLYAFLGASCDGACLTPAVDDGIDGDPERLLLSGLAAQATVSIVVDTYDMLAGGGYTLAVSQCVASCVAGECGMDNGCGGTCGCAAGEVCGAFGLCEPEAPQGNTCADPRPLEVGLGGGLSGLGDLTAAGLSDEVQTGSCDLLGAGYPSDGAGTADEIWSFSVPVDGSYTIAVASDVGTDVFYMLFEGPGCADAACVGYVDNGGEDEIDSHDHELLASKTYTLVIDSWRLLSAGPYLIAIDPSCVPQCTEGTCDELDGCGGTCGCGPGEICDVGFCMDNVGDTCLAPYDMVADLAGDISDGGDLSLADVGDDYEVTACALLDGYENDGRGTPDEVFTFEVTEAGSYRIDVLSDTDADVFFALYSGDLCATSSCLGQVDNGNSGEIDSWELTLAPGPYTLLIDTNDVLAAGAYLIDIVPTGGDVACASDLFFSEYVEAGQGNNKALEIYNGTGSPVDLAGYEIWRANNGDTVAAGGKKFPLKADATSASPILAAGATWVICHASADPALRANCDQQAAGTTLLATFNGDDFIGLVKLSPTPTLIDAIGVEGTDPGNNWPVGDASTRDSVLIRKPEILAGTSDWAVSQSEWLTSPASTLAEAITNSDLGFHDFFWQCPLAP